MNFSAIALENLGSVIYPSSLSLIVSFIICFCFLTSFNKGDAVSNIFPSSSIISFKTVSKSFVSILDTNKS